MDILSRIQITFISDLLSRITYFILSSSSFWFEAVCIHPLPIIFLKSSHPNPAHRKASYTHAVVVVVRLLMGDWLEKHQGSFSDWLTLVIPGKMLQALPISDLQGANAWVSSLWWSNRWYGAPPSGRISGMEVDEAWFYGGHRSGNALGNISSAMIQSESTWNSAVSLC